MAKGVSGFFFGNTPKVPDYKQVDPRHEQTEALVQNEAVLPGAQALGANVNAFNLKELMKAIEFFSPGTLGKVNANISDQLAGIADIADTKAGIRNATAAGFNLGAGGSQFSKFGVVGHLGRSVAQQKQQGLGNFMALSQATRAPQFDITSMFLTPQQRISTAMQNNQNQFSRDWLKAQMDASPHPAGAFTKELIMEAVKAFGGMAGSASGAM